MGWVVAVGYVPCWTYIVDVFDYGWPFVSIFREDGRILRPINHMLDFFGPFESPLNVSVICGKSGSRY